jgi:hypothetical protein
VVVLKIVKSRAKVDKVKQQEFIEYHEKLKGNLS